MPCFVQSVQPPAHSQHSDRSIMHSLNVWVLFWHCADCILKCSTYRLVGKGLVGELSRRAANQLFSPPLSLCHYHKFLICICSTLLADAGGGGGGGEIHSSPPSLDENLPSRKRERSLGALESYSLLHFLRCQQASARNAQMGLYQRGRKISRIAIILYSERGLPSPLPLPTNIASVNSVMGCSKLLFFHYCITPAMMGLYQIT